MEESIPVTTPAASPSTPVPSTSTAVPSTSTPVPSTVTDADAAKPAEDNDDDDELFTVSSKFKLKLS